MTRAEMKERAKQSLGGGIFKSQWLMAVLVMLIYGAVTAAVGRYLPAVGSLIITGPASFALAYMFLKQSRDGQDMNLGDLVKGFTGDFAGNLLLGLMTTLFTVLGSLLLVIPGIVKAYSYSLAFYIKADHPEYDWRACISTSQAMMNGHKMDMFILDLSFIGWYIVGALCAGVGTLFVTPYHMAAHTQFYESLRSAPTVEG